MLLAPITELFGTHSDSMEYFPRTAATQRANRNGGARLRRLRIGKVSVFGACPQTQDEAGWMRAFTQLIAQYALLTWWLQPRSSHCVISCDLHAKESCDFGLYTLNAAFSNCYYIITLCTVSTARSSRKPSHIPRTEIYRGRTFPLCFVWKATFHQVWKDVRWMKETIVFRIILYTSNSYI